MNGENININFAVGGIQQAQAKITSLNNRLKTVGKSMYTINSAANNASVGFSTYGKQAKYAANYTSSYSKSVRSANKVSKTATRNTVMFGNSINKLGGFLKSTVVQLASAYIGVMGVMMVFQRLTGFVKDSIDQFRSFETRMAEVSTILTGDTLYAVSKLQTGVEELSISFGQSADDLANGLYDILSAAIDAKDAIRLLTISTKASIAGLTDVSTSVDVFTSIINAYGKSVAQAQSISDQLFQTVVRGKLRFEDLASAMGYIVPIAANVGVEFKEIAAALSTVTRQGLHVDMSTRGLALMLQNIADITPQAAEAARKYDTELSGLALRVKGLGFVIRELNDASEEFGAKVIPQMIRNMRSYRVAAALASEEGIKGFTKDLDLLNKATGRTEEAMSKMMNTQQRQVDILEETSNLAQRSIGEAWNPLDKALKRLHLTFATLFAGGDVLGTLNNFDLQVKRIKNSTYELIHAQNNLVGSTKVFSDVLRESTDIESTLMNEGNIGAVKEYLNIQEKLTKSAQEWNALQMINAGETIGKIEEMIYPIDSSGGLAGRAQKAAERTVEFFASPFLGASARNIFPEKEDRVVSDERREELNEYITDINNLLDSVDLSDKKIGLVEQGASVSDFNDTINSTIERITELDQEMSELERGSKAYENFFNYFKEGFDTLSEDISETKINIIELENAIEDLEESVGDFNNKTQSFSANYFAGLYDNIEEAPDAFKFKGKLEWELEVIEDSALIDRLSQYAGMATEYGMEYMKPLNDFYGDQIPQSVNNAIETMSEYNEIAEEERIVNLELSDSLDELRLAQQKTTLAMMKLRLKGMKSRHGLRRGDELKMEKLQIKAMKNRIEQTEQTLSVEEELANKQSNITETEYSKAKQIYDRFIADRKHDLFILKDTRNADIINLKETISEKRDKVKLYSSWYIEEIASLKSDTETYIETLRTLSEIAPDLYSDLFDTTYIQDFIDKYKEFESMTDISSHGSSINYATSEELVSGGSTLGTAIQRGDIQDLFLGHQRGSFAVPYTGLHLLHRGEEVVPRGSKRHGDSMKVEVAPITVNARITQDTDARAIGSKIGEAIAAGFVSGVDSQYVVG